MSLTNSKTLALALAVPLLTAACASTGLAWTRTNLRDRAGFFDRDLRVPSGRVAFEIERSGSTTIVDGSEFGAISAAFSTINAAPGSSASLSDAGRFDLPGTVGATDALKQDGHNRIYFFSEDGNNTLGAVATTAIFFTPSTGEILESDIAVNEADYSFSTTTTANPDASLGEMTFDLQEVLTHEMLHALGIGHSPIVGRFDPLTGCQVAGYSTGDFSAHSTMYPYASGTIQGRTLSPDDLAALAAVYPSGEATGAIAGRVTNGATGKGVKGAHVVAVRPDESDVPFVGTISGTGAGNVGGEFSLSGLPPGDYFVRIEALVGSTNPFTERSTDYTGFATDFTPEFYSGAMESSRDLTLTVGDAVAVHVVAGSTTAAVTIVTNALPPPLGLTSASYKSGKLKVTGSGFVVGETACEVDGVLVTDIQFPKRFAPGSVASSFTSRDSRLAGLLASGDAASVVAVNMTTGLESVAIPVRR